MKYSYGIYCYVDTKDDSIVYVGKDSHIDTNTRHKQHHQRSLYDDQPINRILQNNIGRYEYRVLEEGIDDEEELNKKEMEYIKKYKPNRNYTKGGDGSLGYKHSPESKSKMSEARKGKPLSEEHKKKLSENHGRYWSGKTRSPETKRKISETFSETCNKTGFYRVSKINCKNCKNGVEWRYTYSDKTGKRKTISNVDLSKLIFKVTMNDLPIRIVDIDNALDTINNI